MAGIFISYRRLDGGRAGRLKDHLLNRFGRLLVWQDVDDIAPGARWRAEIETAIRQADAVLVVMGPLWLVDDGGRRRLDEPADVLRREIELALATGPEVVPVLVGGAGVPAASDLPRSLAELPDLNAVSLSDADWEHGVDRLFEALRVIVNERREATPLDRLHRELDELQRSYFDRLPEDPGAALELSRQALGLLDQQQPHHPHDAYQQLVRGYSLKNQAMALRDLGRVDEAAEALTRSAAVFRVLRLEHEAHAAGAYNGLGSVEMLRGDFKESLRWIDQALALYPDYPAARRDRELALGYLSRRR